jgi:hypothetical protein
MFHYTDSTTLSSLTSRPADRNEPAHLKLNRRCTHQVMVVADLRQTTDGPAFRARSCKGKLVPSLVHPTLSCP